MARDEHDIMSDLFYSDDAITYVQPHATDVRHIYGSNVTGWLVKYDPQDKPLDDVMEKLTKVSEVLIITQLTPGHLFAIRKPLDLAPSVLGPNPLAGNTTRQRAGRHA